MAEFKNKTHRQSSKPRRTTSYFLGCFGFSRKVPNKKSSSEAVRSEDANKKKTWWFSWSRMRLKKSTIKTVPVDTTTVSEKPTVSSDIKIQSSKLKPKSKSKSKKDKLITVKPKVPTKHNQPPSEIEVVVAATPDQATKIEKVPLEIRYGPANKHSVLRHLQSPNDNDTCQKRLSFGRKIEMLRTGCGKIRSPEVNSTPKSIPSGKLNGEKGAVPVSTKNNKSDPRENVAPTKKYDTVVGMSVIMVTLMILLFCGTLCAILCTSAWFYFVPRLGLAMENNGVLVERTPANHPKSVDLNSGEYKRKVVLDGFLERTRRSPS